VSAVVGDAAGQRRLEALSDGVYAIILTLLVLELKLPALPEHASDADIRLALIGLLPKALAWLLSFSLLALFWSTQQGLYARVAAVDAGLMRLELVLLALVSGLPFSTAVVGEYGDRPTPAALYGAHLCAIALASWARAGYVARRPAMHAAGLSPDVLRAIALRNRLFAACAVATLAGAFVLPGWNLLLMCPATLGRFLIREAGDDLPAGRHALP
jgi:uncharacterized membrane protein